MNVRSKTIWEQWVEKVEAAWPVPAVKIAKLCDCDERTAARIRDYIASKRGEDPPKVKTGGVPYKVDDTIVDEIGKAWPMSLKQIMRRYGHGKAVARRLQKAAISRYGLEENQSIAKQAATIDDAFKRLDEYVAQHGKTNREEMRTYARCSWRTLTEWRKARGIYEPAKVTPRKRDRLRAAYGIESQPLLRRLEQAKPEVVKPQAYAPGRWFRDKRTGETVPALFYVSGNSVKFFQRAE